ncbi:uncharacterized protein (TIGR02284 family) [Saonia flava]|uniref:Uncharacterized protein (TIGR02284 family) n=1 Tax=Saonia flava TaxID=523696 RepID=A0A846QPW1_9FLAO|nr:PA2169 family four-helix-bundle protein [Saonia flava]NJB71086.1 uncharacterized protein (TIGR02284 family) [Saonia flava]
MKYSEKISNKLNDLLEKTYDAENGYRLAKEKVENASVKKFLSDRENERRTFSGELKTEISKYGELPKTEGSLTGNIHRTWMNVKAAVASNKEEKILEEVERGEKASLEEYNEILRDRDFEFPPSTENLLMKQRNAIYASINTAKGYEEIMS